ncbi:MAG TPA: zinc ribbon domain-containing protein [Terracidiphilus sp.]
MPLYEYRCTSCGHSFEKIQKVADAPETACPKCGGELIRPLTAPALQFKGAGWYVNDYASKPSGGSGSDKGGSEKSSSEKSGSEKSGSDSSTGSAGESKPAAESKPAPKESKPASSSTAS